MYYEQCTLNIALFVKLIVHQSALSLNSPLTIDNISQ